MQTKEDQAAFNAKIEVAHEHTARLGGGLRARTRNGYCVRDGGMV